MRHNDSLYMAFSSVILVYYIQQIFFYNIALYISFILNSLCMRGYTINLNSIVSPFTRRGYLSQLLCIPETSDSTKPYTYCAFSYTYIPMVKFNFLNTTKQVVNIYSMNMLDKGMIRLYGGIKKTVPDFIMLLGTVCKLKLKIVFLAFSI